jgi:putative Holliday junction resolvase
MAFPRPALEANESFLVKLASLVEEENVGLVVVGRPLGLSGTATASTGVAKALYDSIVDALAPLRVVEWDERLTTLEAQRSLTSAGIKHKNQRERIDSAAAVVMLQNYVDALLAD